MLRSFRKPQAKAPDAGRTSPATGIPPVFFHKGFDMRGVRDDLTQERLRYLLSYDATTGVFTRRLTVCGNAKAGSEAGTIGRRGYRLIMVDLVLYRAGRLAWLYVHGQHPSGYIDHIDGDRTNNRIENLRDISPRTNSENQRRAKVTNKVGLLGVTSSGRKFLASIQVQGKPMRLGLFPTAELAHSAYLAAKREHHQGCTI